MKYGAMNFPTRSVVKEIEELGKLGFDYVELTIDAPETTPEKILTTRELIKEKLALYKLDIMGHLPTFLSIADLYESIRTASITEYCKALEAGVSLGIKKFVIHPGGVHGLGKQVKHQATKYAQESLNLIVKKANELEVILSIENMFPATYAPTEPQEFERIFQKHPELRFTLDIAHSHINTTRDRSPEFIKRYADKLAHLHVSDNYGKDDAHLPLGAGMIEFKKIFKELKMIGYNETMTLEVFSRDRDYLKMSLEKAKMMWDQA